MAHETDWDQDLRSEEARQQRCYFRRVAGVLLGSAGLVAIVVVAFVALSGCAAVEPQKKREPEVCYLGLIGQTEEGMTVVLSQCMTMEAFKESQKK